MLKLDDLKIASKVLMAIGLLAVVVTGVLAFSTYELQRTNAAYTELTTKQSPAALKGVRAAKFISRYGHGAYSAIVHDDAAGAARGLQERLADDWSEF